ncbi:hypothetical protein GOV09_01935 [Candidatus Woesearchaeota archaeon]|nr:hypothetical protein [Candidatus Woesearchaeota archaeon]
MKKYHPYTYSYLMSFHKDDYGEAYYGIDDMKAMWYEMEKAYKKDSQHFLKQREKYRKIVESYQPLVEEYGKLDITTLSEKQLIELAHEMFESASETVCICHDIEAFSITNDRKLRHAIKDKVDDEAIINRYAELLAHPISKSWANEAGAELYDISQINDKQKQTQLLQEHARKYFWIRNNYLHSEALTAADFREEMGHMKDYAAIDYEAIKKKKVGLITELNLGQDIQELIKHIEFFVDYQDERKKNILISNHYVERICFEFARRFNIPKPLIKYLLPHEFNPALLKNEKLPSILAKRREGYLIILSPDETIVIEGDELKEYDKILHEGGIEHDSDIHGLSASGGTAIGRAVICKTADSMKNLQEGDILVTAMTRPEFVPAMKKAAGIVTDEGGITSHAAIVSRELGKPCVIGTKNATRVIKDGDLVEVKGNHGVVVIIKGAK